MNRAEFLAYWFRMWIGLDFMYDDARINARHLLIRPNENISKLFEKRRQDMNLFFRSGSTDMNMFDYPRFNGYVYGYSG